MNNIHEKDWSEDSWAGHSGKNGCSGRKIAGKEVDDNPVANPDENEPQKSICHGATETKSK